MKTKLVILVCALALSSCGFKKKEAQPPADKQAATKTRLTELFQFCKDGKNADVAEYIDKDVFANKSHEETVDEICRNIKINLTASERHEFKEFHITPPKLGGPELATWVVAFNRGTHPGIATYTFTFRDGKYVLAVEPSMSLAPVPNDAQKKLPEQSSDSTPTGPVPGGILNDKATRLPQPPYPALARSARAAGEVRVAVTVDEYGNVIQASPVSGSPLLQAAAVAAARGAKFEPFKVNGRRVQVKGILKYEFVAP